MFQTVAMVLALAAQPSVDFVEAQQHFKTGALEKAAFRFQQAARNASTVSERADALVWLGATYMALDDSQLAREAFVAALAADPLVDASSFDARVEMLFDEVRRHVRATRAATAPPPPAAPAAPESLAVDAPTETSTVDVDDVEPAVTSSTREVDAPVLRPRLAPPSTVAPSAAPVTVTNSGDPCRSNVGACVGVVAAGVGVLGLAGAGVLNYFAVEQQYAYDIEVRRRVAGLPPATLSLPTLWVPTIATYSAAGLVTAVGGATFAISMLNHDEPDAMRASAGGRFMFAPADYGLTVLEPGTQGDAFKAELAVQLDGLAATTRGPLTAALATLPALVRTPIQQLASAQVAAVTATARSRVLAVYDEQRKPIEAQIAAYNVFADPTLRYDLLEASGAAQTTIEQINEPLLRALHVVRALGAARLMLAHAKTEAAALKRKPNPATTAALAVACFAVVKLSIDAVIEAQAVSPQLQATGSMLRDTLSANPMLALELGAAGAELASATSQLATVASDVPAILDEVAGLMAVLSD